MWKARVESVSAAHLKISVPTKRKKKKITVHLKQSRACPLTSADHTNSSLLGSVRNWRKSPQIYRGGRCGQSEPLAAFPPKIFHQRFFFFVPLFKTKVETSELSALRRKLSPNCARRLQVAAPLSEPPLRSFGRKSKKKERKKKE